MSDVLAVEEKKSTHRCDVVEPNFSRHPDADTLSVTPVYGYTCVGRTTDWAGVKRAIFIPPDSTVDVRRPEFSFLADQAKKDGRARIKAKRLRGVVSYGLLIPAPDDAVLGDDWAERLDVQHFEPPLSFEKDGSQKFVMGGENASGPAVVSYKYDLDAFLRHHHLLEPGEPVLVTEKLDGCSARYVYEDGQFFCGSRTGWKKEYPSYEHLTVASLVGQGMPADKAQEVIDQLHGQPKKQNLWWQILRQTPALEKFCQDHTGLVVYGEVAGNINCIKYGFADVNRFYAFDVLKEGAWMDAEEGRRLLQSNDVPVVPVIAGQSGLEVWPPLLHGLKYDFEAVKVLAEGETTVAGARPGTMREGVVIKPLKERHDNRAGRICFKVVNPAFLEKYR